MSDLQQYKMPILVDVNDIPSVEEDPTHPNASLFCKQYNDLIDAIEQSIEGGLCGCPQEIHTVHELWVNNISGNDNNSGTEELPLLSIEKALEIASSKTAVNNFIINCTGTFTNPVFNISKFCSNKVADSSTDNPFIIFRGVSPSPPYSFQLNITAKYNSILTCGNHNIGISFENCSFNCDTAFLLKNISIPVYFNVVEFYGTELNSEGDGWHNNLLVTDNCLRIILEFVDFYQNDAINCRGLLSTGNTLIHINRACGFYGFDTSIRIFDGARLAHSLGTLNVETSFIEVEQGIFTTRTDLSIERFIIYDGGIVNVRGILYTQNTGNPIANAISGTEITTINNILSALRLYGIIKN